MGENIWRAHPTEQPLRRPKGNVRHFTQFDQTLFSTFCGLAPALLPGRRTLSDSRASGALTRPSAAVRRQGAAVRKVEGGRAACAPGARGAGRRAGRQSEQTSARRRTGHSKPLRQVGGRT